MPGRPLKKGRPFSILASPLRLRRSMNRVFITGASSGLGRALAQQYAASGATLGLLGRREDALRELADSLPGEHRCYAVDVRDRPALHAAAQDFIAFCEGRVDVV